MTPTAFAQHVTQELASSAAPRDVLRDVVRKCPESCPVARLTLERAMFRPSILALLRVGQLPLVAWEGEPRRTKGLRWDALPEYRTYTDTGCQHYHSCLNCIFEVCKLERPDPHPNVKARAERNARIARMLGEGATIEAVSEQFDVSVRTVERVKWGRE